VDAARRALMKLAGGPQLSELNPDAFREQAREYDAVPDLRDSILKLLQLQGNTHPFAVVRFAQLDRWATDGSYEAILSGDYPRRDTDRDASVTDEARSAANSYRESWSRSEDPLAGIFRGVADTGARVAFLPITLGLGAIIWGLEEWFRKSELSCDRAGLLAGQDVDAARRSLMKLAGGPYLSELNPDAFREQAHEYDAVPDLRDSILKLLQLQGNTHPFAVVRFAELDRWATDGSYESILAGDYPRRDTDRDASFTDEVKNAANSYRDSWQRSEDPLAGIFRGVAETGVRAASGLFDRFGGNNRGSGSSGDDN